MKVVAGLGNPGNTYARQRHNIGYMAVEAIASAHGFGPWRDKFQGLVSEGRLANEKVLLLKPETFMNLSGDSVGAALRYYKLDPGDLVVLHDELDLAPGKVRVKEGGGHAGHNGLRSIDAHIGPEFTRVRIGIGHPGDKARVTAHVLGDFTKADTEWLEPLMDRISRGAPALVAGDRSGFMQSVATGRQSAPERPKATPMAEAATTDMSTGKSPEEGKDSRSLIQRLADHFR